MEQERIAPNLLFRSFMIVGGSYFASVVILAMLLGTISSLLFPETFEFLSNPNLTPEQLQNNADLALPTNLFLIVLAAHSLFCIGLGWMVTRFSPYAKFGHAIFVAVVLFVSFLQISVGNTGELQRKTLIMMCVFPVAVLIGAKIQGGQPAPPTEKK